MKPVIFHPSARRELQREIDWYENRQAGLGSRFFREFTRARDRIQSNPLQFAIEGDSDARICRLNKFPIGIVYIDYNRISGLSPWPTSAAIRAAGPPACPIRIDRPGRCGFTQPLIQLPDGEFTVSPPHPERLPGSRR